VKAVKKLDTSRRESRGHRLVAVGPGFLRPPEPARCAFWAPVIAGPWRGCRRGCGSLAGYVATWEETDAAGRWRWRYQLCCDAHADWWAARHGAAGPATADLRAGGKYEMETVERVDALRYRPSVRRLDPAKRDLLKARSDSDRVRAILESVESGRRPGPATLAKDKA